MAEHQQGWPMPGSRPAQAAQTVAGHSRRASCRVGWGLARRWPSLRHGRHGPSPRQGVASATPLRPQHTAPSAPEARTASPQAHREASSWPPSQVPRDAPGGGVALSPVQNVPWCPESAMPGHASASRLVAAVGPCCWLRARHASPAVSANGAGAPAPNICCMALRSAAIG